MMSLFRTVFFCQVIESFAPVTWRTLVVVALGSASFALGREVFPTASPVSSRFNPSVTIRAASSALRRFAVEATHLVARRRGDLPLVYLGLDVRREL